MIAAPWTCCRPLWRGLLFLAVFGASAGAHFVLGQAVESDLGRPVERRLKPVEKIIPTRITFADPQSALERLTSHAWGDVAKNLVQFNPDGTYRHKVTTRPPPMGCGVGLPNFDHRGTWKMRWQDDHGMVQLETGDMLAIAFADKKMFFGHDWLPQTDRLPRNQPEGRTGAAPKPYDELSKFKPNELYAKIARARWRKSDRFNLYMYPTRVQFDPHGRFEAQFREGECKMEGFWSLTGQGTRLTAVSEENLCDMRGPGTASIGVSDQTPEFEGDLIRFYGTSFRPESSKDDDQVFSFDSYSNSVRVTGRLTKPLKKGVAAKLDLTFQARNGDYELREIFISQAAFRCIGNGYSQVGESKPLATVKLGCNLSQGKSITRVVEIVPVDAGADVRLDFDFQYKDIRQSYCGRHGFFGRVDP